MNKNSGSAPSYDYESAYPESAPSPAASLVGGGYNDSQYSTAVSADIISPNTVPSEKGLIFIKTANISLNTEAFDFTVNELRSIVTLYGGFFENSSIHNYVSARTPYKKLNATIRVPAAYYDEVRIAVESLGKHLQTNESSREVSNEYYDLESRIKIKQTEEARILDLIEKADQLSQLIELERRLGEVRTDIEIYESRLKQIDSLASYSTINIDITERSEEDEPENEGFFARLKNGFINSLKTTLDILQGVVIFIAYISVPAVLLGILAIVALLILKRFKKKGDE